MTEIPEFSPRHPDPVAKQGYAEPPSRRVTGIYDREHTEIFAPIRHLFDILREIAMAHSHHVGSFE